MHRRPARLVLIISSLMLIPSLTFASLRVLRSSPHYTRGAIVDVTSDGAGNAFIIENPPQERNQSPRPSRSSQRTVQTMANSVSTVLEKVDLAGRTLSKATFKGIALQRVAADRQGRAVVAGVKDSFASDFAPPAEDPQRLFVCKMDASGSNVLWKRSFSDAMSVDELVVANDGSIFVGGSSSPATFAGAHVIGPASTNQSHPFIAKLSSNGTLQFITIFGGGWPEYLAGLAVNSAGEIFATGWGTLFDFPGIPPSEFDYGSHGFVVKLSNDGQSLLSAQALRGSCEDRSSGIALDAAGNVYVSGATCSTDFPGQGANPPTSNYHGFVSKLDSKLSTILWTSFIGKSQMTRVDGVHVLENGTLVLAGNFWGYFDQPGVPFVATADSSGDITMRDLGDDCGPTLSFQRFDVDSRGRIFAQGIMPPANGAAWFEFGSFAGWTPLPPPISAAKPQLLFFDPTTGSTVGTNAELTLSAVVLGAPGATVQFFDGKTLVGTSTNEPFTLLASNWSRGAHTLYAKAIVNGKTLTSCRVRIHVKSPPNDRFDYAREIFEEKEVRGTLDGSTPDPLPYNSWSDVWYFWTATRDGVYSIQATANLPQLGIQTLPAEVYTGSRVTNLTAIHSSWNWPSVFRVVQGTTYRIRISHHAPRPMTDFHLRLRSVTAPANDDYANAIELSGVPAEASGTTLNATRELFEGIYGSPTVWYKWTVPSNGLYLVSVDAGYVNVYRGPTNELVYSGTRVMDLTNTTLVSATNGEVLQLSIAGYFPRSQRFTLRIEAASAATNDDFTNAVEVAGVPATSQGSTLGATMDWFEDDFWYYTRSGSVWWKWIAPSSGVYRARMLLPPTADASGLPQPNFDERKLTVYTNFTEFDEMLVLAQSEATSGTVFRAEAGVEYHFSARVGNYTGVTFSIAPASPPSNDEFTNATVLAGDNVLVAGTLHDSSVGPEDDPFSPWYFVPTGTVWYRWTAPSDGAYAVNVSGAQWSVFRVGSSPFGIVQTYNKKLHAKAGDQFAIMVYATSNFRSPPLENFTLNIHSITPPANDDRANAAMLSGFNVTFSASHTNATPETNEYAGQDSLWWQWTAPTNGTFAFQSSSSVTLRILTTNGYWVSINSTPDSYVFVVTNGETYLIGISPNDDVPWVEYTLRYVPPPPNDDFENAVVITSLPFTSSNTVYSATMQSGETRPTNWFSINATVWWQWTASTSSLVLIETVSDGWTAPIVAAFAGDSVTNLYELATSYQHVVLRVNPGVTYHFSVSGWWQPGAFTLSVKTIEPPPNDNFIDRLTMTNGVASGLLTGATTEPGEWSMPSVWWRWVAPTTGLYEVSNDSVLFEVGLYAGIDRFGTTSILLFNLQERVSPTWPYTAIHRVFLAQAGTEYQMAVRGDAQSLTPYTVKILERPIPANNHFTNAARLTGTHATVVMTNRLCDMEPTEPDRYGYNSVWWRWTAPSNGTFVATAVRSVVLTVTDVFTGNDLDTLRRVNTSHGGEQRTFRAEAGVDYVFRIMTVDPVYAKLVLDVGYTNAPLNDDFRNALVLSGANVSVHGSNYHATVEPDEPFTGRDFNLLGQQSVWYSWRAPAAGNATVNLTWTNSNFALHVFTGSNVTALTAIASNTPGPAQFTVQAGVTYALRVDSNSDRHGEFDLSLSFSPATTTVGVILTRLPPGAIIESSTNLIHWNPVATNSVGASEMRLPSGGSEPMKFYRWR